MAIERDGMTEEVSESMEIEPIMLDTSKMPVKVGDIVKYRVTDIDENGMATAEYAREEEKKGVRALADEYE